MNIAGRLFTLDYNRIIDSGGAHADRSATPTMYRHTGTLRALANGSPGRAPCSSCHGVGKILGQRPKLLLHLFRKSVATHTPKQLVIKRFVANKDSACGLHPGNGRPNVWRGGKQQVLHYVDFVVEAKKPEAGLEHTDIRLAARHEDLRPFQMLEVIPDLSFLRQVEEILLEKLGPIAQVLHDFPGAGSLLIHRPFERHHDRNSEIGAGEPISSRGSQGLSRGSVGWLDLPLVAA